MCLKYILLFYLALASKRNFAQNKEIGHVDGDVVLGKKTVITKNYYEKPELTPLNVSKYIDTTRPIHIYFGSESTGVRLAQLRAGIAPIIISDPITNAKILFIKMVKGRLEISSDVFDFDNKLVVKLENDKVVGSRAFSQYLSDSLLEIFDDYNIPVLQIQLLKECNCIYVGGVFGFSQGYMILSKAEGMRIHQTRNPQLLMKEAERDSARYEYLRSAKVIEPIHVE